MDSPADDFNGMLAAIEARFRNPPRLDFGSLPADRATFDFPRIAPASERRLTSPPSSELSRFFEAATRKFYYQDFISGDVAPVLSWPNERMSRRGRLIVERSAEPDDCVNRSKEAASEWFRFDLVGGITHARQPSCSFFVGLPGSGKSTLMKYLINAERDYSKENGVVFSRFESTKFFRYCGEWIARRGTDPGEPWPTRELMSCFRDYWWSVVLRDLILNEAFLVNLNGKLERNRSSSNFRTHRDIDDFVARACEAAGADDAKHQQAFTILTSCLDGRAFDHKSVFQIDPALKRAMVKILSANLKVCVVFDGLDSLSPEDEVLDQQKFAVLEFILVMYGYGSRGVGSFDPGLDHHAIIMMRPNTYERFVDRVDKEIKISEVRTYRIAQLSPGVVLLRAIRRALKDVGLPDQEIEAFSGILYRSLGTLLVSIGTKFRLEPSAEALLSMFNGNLRDCFEYVMRVFVWMNEEGEARALHRRPGVSDLVKFISSPEARRLLRQKNYRLIELLLFYQTSSFQNAIVVSPSGIVATKATKELFAQPGLQKNNVCRGLIDNVFNYHSFDDATRNDEHNLLHKIRILQVCLENGASTLAELDSALKALGYDLSRGALEKSVIILRFVGFLDRRDEGGISFFAVSTKGRVVVERLVFQSSYLEHVFHKTLLPTTMIGRIRADTPRLDRLDRWTTESIRNYFTLLTYVHFVEGNPARGKSVPEKFRIWPAMAESVVAAVRRILVQDHANKRTKSPTTWYAKIAHDEIEELVRNWRAEGLC